MTRRSEPEDFWGRLESQRIGECWPFVGHRDQDGYGKLDFRGRAWLAHRLAFHLATGWPVDGYCVMHSCDNPPCCNPAHLTCGTHLDNMRDRDAKGRLGIRHRKLSAKDVQLVRSLRRDGLSQDTIAKAVGVSQSRISEILRGLAYTELADE